jgi:Fe-S cluster assembly iron-binding protein IscA
MITDQYLLKGIIDMLTVTEAAKQKLKATLLANTNDFKNGLRLKMKSPGNVGLVIDKPSPSDTVFEYEGLKILLIEHAISELFDRATLDLHKSGNTKKLTIYQD